MRASETDLRNFLEGGKQFQVPLFQRPYVWSEENWESLWDDMMSLYEDGETAYHFLGPIVTLAFAGTAEGISPFVVIDGQQRLITLTLILAAVRDSLRESGKETQGNEVHDLYLINRYKAGDNIYKILPTQTDRAAYKSFVQGKHPTGSSRLIAAFDYFRSKLTRGLMDNGEPVDVEKLKTIILGKLTLVSITLDDRDNPHLIFESLNYKGTPLTQADLIRNFFFMRLPSAEHDKVYSELWLPMQDRFTTAVGDDYLDELTNAFWYYLRKDGGRLNHGEVYQTIKARLSKPGQDILKSMEELARFAEYYRRINFPQKEREPRLSRWFRRFLRLDFTTSYPFLLNLYDDYSQKSLSLDRFEEMLLVVESYFVRRLFVGIPTNALNRLFNGLYSEIDKGEKIVDSLRSNLSARQRTQLWPSDEQFRDAILQRPIYTDTRTDRVKLLLESLEETLTKEHVDPGNLTIEHIMPQTLTDEWRGMLGPKHAEVYDKWLHTAGNLTLTAYNAELSNKPFDEKLEYLRDSGLALNKYFDEVTTWNEGEIKRRAEYLATIACQVWPK
jgi:uncharacterized protein with ParB-like and HNH nuclease domain